MESIDIQAKQNKINELLKLYDEAIEQGEEEKKC